MQVFKIEKPILALALLSVADGNNFGELSAEVSEVGGSAELINDELARVKVNGREYELPIGYVLVFDGGHNRANGSEHIGYGRLLGKAQFDVEYVSVGAGEFDLDAVVVRADKVSEQVDDLVARLGKVETELGKLNKPKSEPKAKADKANEPTAGA